jgi:N-acetylmuramoyl-L-alanine amidase
MRRSWWSVVAASVLAPSLLVACTEHAGRSASPPLSEPAAVASVQPSTVASPPASIVPALVGVEATESPVDAANFPAGACVRFSSDGVNKGATIFLDAGHGGPDPGGYGPQTNGRTIEEKTVTLAVVRYAAAALHKLGFTVVVSRTTDTAVAKLTASDRNGTLLTVAGLHADLVARVRCADEAHANVLVSVHANSGGSSLDAGSLTTYDAARTFSAANLLLAQLLQKNILAQLNSRGWAIPDAGVLADTDVGNAVSAAGANYGHLIILGPAAAGFLATPSSMPGALIEPLFLTDPFEANVAASAAGQALIANGIVVAVQQFLHQT